MFAALLFSLVLSGQDPAEAPAPAEPRANGLSEMAADRDVPGANTGDQRIVCQRQRETGSNRSRNVCTRVGVANYNRDRARQWRDSVVDNRATPECETNISAVCPAPRT